MRKLREAGLLPVLDMGVQYPPAWVRQLPGAQFVNQFGQVYDQRSPGANGVNAVFSQAVRERQAAYAARLFRDLGDDFFAVRLGWGYYGELQYPMHKYEGKTNCYWAYDELAQGPGPACPWRPVVPGARLEARREEPGPQVGRAVHRLVHAKPPELPRLADRHRPQAL